MNRADPMFLEAPSGRRLAYHQRASSGPGIVFLGGFASDMTGTKAQFLDYWCAQRGRAYLRFDYSGHGASSGRFEDGTIGAWAEDARTAITTLTEGRQVLVGSSMGGWISLLMARQIPERIAALVTIAAAPDFTEDLTLPGLSTAQKAELARDGQLAQPSQYGAPLIITQQLLDEARGQLVLRAPLRLPFPVRLLHGTDDVDVPLSRSEQILAHAEGPDMHLITVKGADHRFSDPRCLALIGQVLEALAARKAAP